MTTTRTEWNRPNGFADGKKVKALRTRLRMNQEKFSEAVGVSRPTISHWETGDWAISPDNQAKLDRLAGG